MNRKINLLLLALIVIIGGIMTLNYFQSFKPVYVQIPRAGVSATVLDANKHQVGQLSGSGKLSLRPGKYSVVPGGTNISTTPLPLTVKNDGAYVTVDPGYSGTYLDQLLDSELGSIQAAITAKYPTITQGFTLDRGVLYQYGDWYSALIVQNSPGPGARGDLYRVVLHKTNDTWNIAAGPAIVLSDQDYPDVPKSILSSTNALLP